MDEPTSWYAIVPGWEVVDRSGNRLGEVTAVVGDEDADIFDGLRIDAGGKDLYARGDQVGEIVDGRVSVDASADELDASPPGGAEVTRDRDAEL